MKKIIAVPARQGDVPILKLSGFALPANATVGTQLTVKLGEATGHHHTLYPLTPSAVIRSATIDGTLYFEITEDWILRHQQHDEIRITPGIYEIGAEREYNPFEQAMKRVVD